MRLIGGVRARALFSELLLVSLVVVEAHGQRVRGVVVLGDSTTPAVGAIVDASPADRGGSRGTLTSERGTFELSFGAPGRYSLRVRRIGYRPTVVPAVDLSAGETRELRIVLDNVPVQLRGILVRGETSCRSRPDAGDVSTVWEEARKALLSSVLARPGSVLAEWVSYDRSVDPASSTVREQRVHTTSGATAHAFTSMPAPLLAQRGYIVREAEVTTYYAPDADVLLSESFAATHCFGLHRAADQDGDFIGVTFKPIRDPKDFSDIEGTFWIERASSQLKWMDFLYVGVSAPAERAGVGGRVEFLHIPSGEWLVKRWHIRMPEMVTAPSLTDAGTRRVIVASPDAKLRRIAVTGGELVRVRREGVPLYDAPGPGLSLQVLPSDAVGQVDAAVIRLEGTDYETRTDTRGRATLQPVLEGRYRVHISTPLLDAIGATRIEKEVMVKEGSEHVDTLALPHARDLLEVACGARAPWMFEGMIYGTILDSTGQAVPHAAVTLSWQRYAQLLVGTTERPAIRETRAVVADAAGRWRSCGIPLKAQVSIAVSADAGAAEQHAVITDESRPFVERSLTLVSEAAASTLNGDVALEISTRDRSGAITADAQVDITTTNAKVYHLRTDSAGRSVLVGIPAGPAKVRARSIGMAPGEFSVVVGVGRNTLPVIFDRARAPTLDTVRIAGNRRVLMRHQAFEERRLRHEATASYTSEDIGKRGAKDAWQMLTNVPSVKVADIDGIVVARSMRGELTGFTDRPCYLAVMIDGMVMPTADLRGRPNLQLLPPTTAIYGIEVFSGASTIPLQYRSLAPGMSCGLIAVWTR